MKLSAANAASERWPQSPSGFSGDSPHGPMQTGKWIPDQPWRRAGVQLVHNWLGLVARRKAARNAATFAVARWGG